MSKSFDDVNVGDEFACAGRRNFGWSYLTVWEKHTVVRVTPKRFFTKTDGCHLEFQWRRDNGWSVGGGFNALREIDIAVAREMTIKGDAITKWQNLRDLSEKVEAEYRRFPKHTLDQMERYKTALDKVTQCVAQFSAELDKVLKDMPS